MAFTAPLHVQFSSHRFSDTFFIDSTLAHKQYEQNNALALVLAIPGDVLTAESM